MKLKIIIVEDEAIIAEDIKSTLKLLGYKVVGHAYNGDKALDLFANHPADLVLLDISIKGTLSGIDLAKVLNEKYQIPFIFLTSFSDKATLERVIETSPYGYILKPFNENDLKVNIELAMHKYYASNIEHIWSKEFVEHKNNIELSDREYSILTCFKDGLTYKETGEKLFISVNTVKTYQKKLFQKFDVKNKFELINKM